MLGGASFVSPLAPTLPPCRAPARPRARRHRKSKALVAADRGRELMLVPGWWYVISAESFLDRMTEMPDVLVHAPTIRCPTLFIRGDEESPETYPAERFKERAGGPCEVEIVPNCNHFYVGREATICKLVSGWLVRTLNIGAGVPH
jgi:pimeloyl-ACP methyl ester carboxylesterase